MNEPSQLNLLTWGSKLAKDHPLLATLGVLGILIVLTFTVGQSNNTNFVSILLALAGVAFALFYTFSPTPSMKRGVVALLLAVLWVSALLDRPFPLQSRINALFERKVVNFPAPTTPASANATPAQPASAASAPVNARPASAPLPPTPVFASFPFSASSGSINVGCGNTGSATATFTMPAGAVLESASAGWANTSNLSSATQSTAQSGANIVANGAIRGLDFQSVFGIRNCPGGGHGTLVLSGSYKAPVQ